MSVTDSSYRVHAERVVIYYTKESKHHQRFLYFVRAMPGMESKKSSIEWLVWFVFRSLLAPFVAGDGHCSHIASSFCATPHSLYVLCEYVHA